jgi:hypothetical protein
LLPGPRFSVFAPKRGFPWNIPLFDWFRPTLGFLFQTGPADSAAISWVNLFALGKDSSRQPAAGKTAFLSPKNEEERAFRFRFSETLPGLTVWPNDRNFIAHELQFRSPVFKRGNENV